MKQYVIDQLREPDYNQIKDYLDQHTISGPMDGTYWVHIPEELYSEIQHEHKGCQPYYFAINLYLNYIEFEFLIRSRTIFRCSCISYATKEQRDFIIDYADNILKELSIKV